MLSNRTRKGCSLIIQINNQFGFQVCLEPAFIIHANEAADIMSGEHMFRSKNVTQPKKMNHGKWSLNAHLFHIGENIL